MGTMDVSDSDSDEEGQAFYAGGSTTSGQQVGGRLGLLVLMLCLQILGPKKKKFNIGNVFKAAKEAGAEEVEAGGFEGQGGSGTRWVKALEGQPLFFLSS